MFSPKRLCQGENDSDNRSNSVDEHDQYEHDDGIVNGCEGDLLHMGSDSELEYSNFEYDGGNLLLTPLENDEDVEEGGGGVQHQDAKQVQRGPQGGGGVENRQEDLGYDCEEKGGSEKDDNGWEVGESREGEDEKEEDGGSEKVTNEWEVRREVLDERGGVGEGVGGWEGGGVDDDGWEAGDEEDEGMHFANHSMFRVEGVKHNADNPNPSREGGTGPADTNSIQFCDLSVNERKQCIQVWSKLQTHLLDTPIHEPLEQSRGYGLYDELIEPPTTTGLHIYNWMHHFSDKACGSLQVVADEVLYQHCYGNVTRLQQVYDEDVDSDEEVDIFCTPCEDDECKTAEVGALEAVRRVLLAGKKYKESLVWYRHLEMEYQQQQPRAWHGGSRGSTSHRRVDASMAEYLACYESQKSCANTVHEANSGKSWNSGGKMEAGKRQFYINKLTNSLAHDLSKRGHGYDDVREALHMLCTEEVDEVVKVSVGPGETHHDLDGDGYCTKTVRIPKLRFNASGGIVLAKSVMRRTAHRDILMEAFRHVYERMGNPLLIAPTMYHPRSPNIPQVACFLQRAKSSTTRAATTSSSTKTSQKQHIYSDSQDTIQRLLGLSMLQEDDSLTSAIQTRLDSQNMEPRCFQDYRVEHFRDIHFPCEWQSAENVKDEYQLAREWVNGQRDKRRVMLSEQSIRKMYRNYMDHTETRVASNVNLDEIAESYQHKIPCYPRDYKTEVLPTGQCSTTMVTPDSLHSDVLYAKEAIMRNLKQYT